MPPVLPVAAMVIIVAASNVLVQYPFTPFGLQDLLTWGAFTYPVSFFVTDATNRTFGSSIARKVVYVGFAAGVVLSAVLSEPRIAVASGTAFLFGQLLDIGVFNRLRRLSWWRAPLVSSIAGSALDTALFFSLAFAGTGLGSVSLGMLGAAPVWVTWAIGDFAVKGVSALLMLVPYGLLLARASFYQPAR